MSAASLRLLIGFVLMVMTCSASYALGDRPVRKMAMLIGFSWIACVLVQLATGHLPEPAIAGDVLCALVTLAWAWNGGRVWLWAMVGVESCLLLLHALLYTVNWRVTRLEIVVNNILSVSALTVMLAAAVLSRRRKGI
jgi:hypothetical protein